MKIRGIAKPSGDDVAAALATLMKAQLQGSGVFDEGKYRFAKTGPGRVLALQAIRQVPAPGEVGDDRLDLGDHVVDLLLRSRGDHHAGAGIHESVSDHPADAVAAAGDHRHTARQ